MGKLPAPQPLRSKRKAQQVTVRTPEQGVVESGTNLPDLQSSYFSICYLLQSENDVSLKLVTENNVLSQILEKLTNGCPRDVEQLSLSALASALSWAPSEVLNPLLQQGLLDFCWGVLQRSGGTRGVADPTGDTSLELLRDLVYLDERVAVWVLDQMETVLSLLTSSPNISLRRGCARLIYALVEVCPGAFVPGLPESRLTHESMQVIFSELGCSDVETCCFITMSGLLLEGLYGAAVIPAVTNMKLDMCRVIGDILLDCVSFTVAPTEQEEFRLSLFRSRLRGVSSLLEMLADGIAETLDDKIGATDSIEDRQFFVAGKSPMGVEFQAVVAQNLLSMDSSSVLACIGNLASQLVSSGRGEHDEDVSAEDSCTTGVTGPCTILDDQDVRNVFELVSQWVRLDRYIRFRFEQPETTPRDGMILFSCRVLSMQSVDLVLGDVLLGECCDWLRTLLKRVLVAGGVTLDENVFVDILAGVSRISGLISSFDESIIESCMEALQLVFLLSKAVEVRGKCAELLVTFLAKTNPNHPPSDEFISAVCAAIECVFVIFGEAEMDGYLVKWDWVDCLQRIRDTLKTGVRGGHKSQRNERSEYVLGTTENITAFIQYKRR